MSFFATLSYCFFSDNQIVLIHVSVFELFNWENKEKAGKICGYVSD